jgi:hypothetical protein
MYPAKHNLQVQVLQQRIIQLQNKRVALCRFIETTKGPKKYIKLAYCDLEEVSASIARYKTKIDLIQQDDAQERYVDHLLADWDDYSFAAREYDV